MLGMKSRDDLLVPAEARGAGHGSAREAPGNAPELALGSRRQQDLPRSFDGLTFRPCDAETGGELAARNSAIQLSPPNRFSDLQPAKTLSPAAWRAAQTSRKTRSNSGGRASKKLALDGNFYGVFGEVSAPAIRPARQPCRSPRWPPARPGIDARRRASSCSSSIESRASYQPWRG